MSLKARIFALAGGFAVLAVLIVAFGISIVADYSRTLTEYGRAWENAYRGERLNHLISNAVMESRGIYLAKSPQEAHQFADRLHSNLDSIENQLKTWPEPGLESDPLRQKTLDFIRDRREIARLGIYESPAAAEAMGTAVREKRMVFQTDIELAVARTRSQLEVAKAHAETYNQRRVLGFGAIALGAVILTVLLSLWLIRHFITRELERARIAEEAREALLKQLMQSNTELERFAYVASHDMQEPVRMVSIFSGMVANDYGDKLDTQGRQYLGIIKNASERMLHMIQDLLNYARLHPDIAAGDQVDLNAELKHVRANLGELIASEHAVIKADPLPQVSGNAIQLQRLLQNLIANGIKYAHPDRPPEVRIRCEDGEGEWRIGVRDNGVGIGAEFFGDIFEPFRRLHTWDQVSGTGMGLPISRKIVEYHGGRIWVESTPGEGSCFWFSLRKPAETTSIMPQNAVLVA